MYFLKIEDIKNFKFSDFQQLVRNLPNSLYHFWNNLRDFLKTVHHCSMPWQITVDTLDRARTWNFKFSDCQPLLWNCNASPALHLQALSCPTLHYIALHSQPCPTLPCCVILTLLLVLTWYINWWNTQQNVEIFIAFFDRYLLTPSATLSFTPSFTLIYLSFIYIWLVIPKFLICKCFGNFRKDHFRLFVGGFLALPSPNFVWNFDQWFNAR